MQDLRRIAALIRAEHDGDRLTRDETITMVANLLVGGHDTTGSQIVQVETARGTAVLASDAAKLYRHITEEIPQSHSHSTADQVRGCKLMKRLATSEDLIIPGHDPEAIRRLPAYADGIALLA